MAERPTYSAVEKRAVYSQKGVINTRFERMGSYTLQVPRPHFSYSPRHTASTMNRGGTGVGSSSRDPTSKVYKIKRVLILMYKIYGRYNVSTQTHVCNFEITCEDMSRHNVCTP